MRRGDVRRFGDFVCRAEIACGKEHENQRGQRQLHRQSRQILDELPHIAKQNQAQHGVNHDEYNRTDSQGNRCTLALQQIERRCKAENADEENPDKIEHLVFADKAADFRLSAFVEERTEGEQRRRHKQPNDRH